jgi:hypothetical protein
MGMAISVHSYSHQNILNLGQVNDALVSQVEQFFVTCNQNRGKKFIIKGRHGPKRAAKLVKAGIAAFQKSI